MLKEIQESLPLYKKIFKIAFPVILQNLSFYIMNFVNSAFIGHYQFEGLAAIQNVMIPFNMLNVFFLAFVQGTTIMVAQSVGAKDIGQAAKISESSFFYNQLVAIGYFCFWFFFGREVQVFMGIKGDLLVTSTRYLKILAFMYLSMGFSQTASSIFQGIGNTTPIMLSVILRSALNVFFDYCLIFGNWGFPELGISGAAVSTVISVTASSLFLTGMIFFNKVIPLSVKNLFRPHKGYYIKAFRFGYQAGLELMLWSAAQVLLVRMFNVVDELGAGYYGVMNLLIQLSNNTNLGIGVATMTLTGNAAGAGDYKALKKIGNTCVVLALLFCSVICLFLVIVPRQMVSLFTEKDAVINYLAPIVFIVAFLIFPKSVNVISGYAIRGMGDTRWMLITQVAGSVLTVSMAALFLFVLHWNLSGLILANFIDETWRALVNYRHFRTKTKLLV